MNDPMEWRSFVQGSGHSLLVDGRRLPQSWRHPRPKGTSVTRRYSNEELRRSTAARRILLRSKTTHANTLTLMETMPWRLASMN